MAALRGAHAGTTSDGECKSTAATRAEVWLSVVVPTHQHSAPAVFAGLGGERNTLNGAAAVPPVWPSMGFRRTGAHGLGCSALCRRPRKPAASPYLQPPQKISQQPTCTTRENSADGSAQRPMKGVQRQGNAGDGHSPRLVLRAMTRAGLIIPRPAVDVDENGPSP